MIKSENRDTLGAVRPTIRDVGETNPLVLLTSIRRMLERLNGISSRLVFSNYLDFALTCSALGKPGRMRDRTCSSDSAEIFRRVDKTGG